MASQITAESPVSKTKEEIIREAKRIEEALLYSSKGHFVASHFWQTFHLWIGIPAVILSATAGASAFAAFDHSHVVAGVISIVVAVLSAIITFLNPNEKRASHLTAGNHYDSLMNKIRIFWSIDCWREESEQVLTEKLKYFSEQKDRLNEGCPQIPPWAYSRAKKGIADGESAYVVDKMPNL
jgi:hypothetical protein